MSSGTNSGIYMSSTTSIGAAFGAGYGDGAFVHDLTCVNGLTSNESLAPSSFRSNSTAGNGGARCIDMDMDVRVADVTTTVITSHVAFSCGS